VSGEEEIEGIGRRIWNENLKLAYIFGGPVPEQKPVSTVRSRGKRPWKIIREAEAGCGRICSKHPCAHDRRSDGLGVM
jgi:hypothetical protein